MRRIRTADHTDVHGCSGVIVESAFVTAFRVQTHIPLTGAR